MYNRLMLLKTLFQLNFFNWVMSFLQLVSFTILFNRFSFDFFHPSKGIQQGFSYAHLLFLLVVEGLSRVFAQVNLSGSAKGIYVVRLTVITCLMFIDGILIFSNANGREA